MFDDRIPLLVGFMKVRNEIARNGNIYRSLCNMQYYCDDVYVCDDSSWDGTYEYLQSILPEDHIIRVPPDEHDFRNELFWKQKLLELIHKNGPMNWIYWQDADEVLDANGTENIREFCKKRLTAAENGYVFHYTQLWRSSNWARTDDSFDEGNFIKLWKWSPSLKFNVVNGTHHSQFPVQVNRVAKAPFEVIHFGNFGVNLRWKCIQYYGGLGGVDRHLKFDNATYRMVSKSLFPPGCEYVPTVELPQPFTADQIEKTLSIKDLHNLEKTFCVIIPTYNRAHVLKRTLDSVLKQTYGNWICFVLDDASTDNTSEIMWEYQEKDPRIFYARYLAHCGGVKMNELGMDIACNTAEYWTRLGSDDFFLPDKLERDFKALQLFEACYGPFVVNRNSKFEEVCSPPMTPKTMRERFAKKGFEASWASIAVKTSVLKKIKEKYGNYVDPQLQNMEDLLFNNRLLKFTDIIWRGKVDDVLYINPTEEEVELINKTKTGDNYSVEAVWTIDEVAGSSYNNEVYNRDYALSQQIIQAENR
jgi:glycosyltransferase involved in cell wall biosynthesis